MSFSHDGLVFSFFAVQPVWANELGEAFVGFENIWLNCFWLPCSVKGDLAFSDIEFSSFLLK